MLALLLCHGLRELFASFSGYSWCACAGAAAVQPSAPSAAAAAAGSKGVASAGPGVHPAMLQEMLLFFVHHALHACRGWGAPPPPDTALVRILSYLTVSVSKVKNDIVVHAFPAKWQRASAESSGQLLPQRRPGPHFVLPSSFVSTCGDMHCPTITVLCMRVQDDHKQSNLNQPWAFQVCQALKSML